VFSKFKAQIRLRHDHRKKIVNGYVSGVFTTTGNVLNKINIKAMTMAK
jgi:hypothetical protein